MQEERAEYRILFPEPGPWKGWWDNEDTDKALDMESSVWILGSRRASLSTPDSAFNKKFASERKYDQCLFWVNHFSQDCSMIKSSLSKW